MEDLMAGLRKKLGGDSDWREREAAAGGDGAAARLCWMDSLVDERRMGEDVLRPFTDPGRFGRVKDPARALERIRKGGIYSADGKLRDRAADLAADLLSGRCALIFPTLGLGVSFEVRGTDRRSVEAPKEEKVLLGAKDAFNETLKTNVALVRRRLDRPEMRVEEVESRCRCPVQLRLVWMEGLADPGRVDTVRERLRRMDADALLTPAVLVQALSDEPESVLPQLLSTERADRFALNLLEGRVGVLADGLPLGWLAPAPMGQFFRVPEDEALHPVTASVLTALRFLGMLLSLLLPAFFVAVSMYHQEMLPPRLMQAVITAKLSVPFPSLVETVTMLAVIELLQEAGLHLPTPVGETISILGALLVGQAAIEAKLVSPVVVIAAALSAIAGYTTPSQEMAAALRLGRFLLVLAAGAGGMLGLSAGLTLLIHRLASLEVLGVPYASPFSTASLRLALRGILRRTGDAGRRRDETVAADHQM